MKALVLSAPEGSIEIDMSRPEWCHCTYLHGVKRRPLGAGPFDYICRQLSRDLRTNWDELDKPAMGEVDGLIVRWVLSLSEEHSTLYVAKDIQQTVLFWQDKNAVLICRITLDHELEKEWIQLLQSMVNSL